MDHQADFELLTMRVLKKEVDIDWTSPRLLCIARDFTRYDDYAIGQINRNIELIRYRYFQDDNIIFELAGTAQKQEQNNKSGSNNPGIKYRGMEDAISASSQEILSLYQELEDFIFSLGDDVQKKELKHYHAYSRIKNFVCVEIKSKKNELALYLRLDFNQINNPSQLIRDVSKIGHFGTGDTEAIIRNMTDLESTKLLIEQSYINS